MADNTTLDAGSGGDVIATDDIGGVKYQRVKISQGADGSATDVGIGGGTEATALRVTVANDSTGVVSVGDNGGSLTVDDGGLSLTVDGSVSITGTPTVDTELTTADLDTGAGTDTRAVVGIVGSKSGGAAIIPGDATAGLKVDLGADNDVTVTGSVTANAGTNLNTSTLALESGGNLAAAAASLSVLDDWDETDRAKVNLIVGQAGIAAGTGVDGATVPRVTLATNVALPAGTNAIGKLAANDGVDVGDVTINNSTGGSAVNIQDGGNSITVDNSGTFVVQDNQVVTDNAGFTDGTTKVFVTGFVYDEVAGTALTENDAAAARINVNRAQVGIIEDGTTRGRYATVSASNALKVDGSGVTQPVSIAAAVAVTDNSGSLTVDNSGTFLVQDSEKVADNGGFTDGTTKVLPAGFIFDEVAGTALTENDVAAARIDSKRATVGVIEDATTRGRRATVTAGGALLTDASATTQPVSYATTGSGNATGALRVELANNGTGVLATVGAVTSITNALPTGTNTIGNAGIIPRTSGGLSIYRNIDLDEADVAVKGSAGQLFGWYIYNAAASVRYVKFYDASTASTTVGTTTPVLTIPVPAGAAANVFSDIGIAFATAITAACVTGVADNNTGAPSANDVQVNLFYA